MGDFGGWGQLAERDIEAVLVVAIAEVVVVVSNDAVLKIVHGSFLCSFASPREISFLCWGAGVEDAQHVSIVSPPFSECLLKTIVESLEWSFVWLRY